MTPDRWRGRGVALLVSGELQTYEHSVKLLHMTGKRRRTTTEQDEVLAELRRTAATLSKASAARDEQIRRASSLGLSRRAVAEAAGITYGRVQQIVNAQA